MASSLKTAFVIYKNMVHYKHRKYKQKIKTKGKLMMFFVNGIYKIAPSELKLDLQKKTYLALDKLHIPFERIDDDETITYKMIKGQNTETLFAGKRQ